MKLSIIIPVYNVEKYLDKCFESILLNQNFELEVVLVNDESTDSSLEIANKIASKNNFVKVISQQNQGLSGARNTGLKNATGDYVLFLDADDWLNFETIEKLVPFALKNDIEVTGYRMEFFNEKYESTGSQLKHPIKYEVFSTGIDFLIQGYQPSSSCLFIFEKDFLIKNELFFVRNLIQEDVEFTTRMMLKAKKVYFSEQIGYNYFRNQGTLSIPSSNEKLKKYLYSSVEVATIMKSNCKNFSDNKTIQSIQKNYNSVVWNLILRFLVHPKEVDSNFKIETLKTLKLQELYPIKGALKTNFQRLVRLGFNSEFLLKFILKLN